MKYTPEEELILKTLSFYEEMDFAKIVLDLDSNELKNFPELNREKIEAILDNFEKKKLIKVIKKNENLYYKKLIKSNKGKNERLFIVFIILAVLITLLLINKLIPTNEPSETEIEFERLRYKEFTNNLNKIKNGSEDINLFIGASTWERFLNPKDFDDLAYKNNQNVKSYNLSFGGLAGYSLYALSLDLKSRKFKKKINTIYLELSVLVHSKKFHRARRNYFNYKLPFIYLNKDSEFEYFKNNPTNYVMAKWIVPNFLFNFKAEILNLPTIYLMKSLEIMWHQNGLEEEQKWNFEKRGWINFNREKDERPYEDLLRFTENPFHWESFIKNYVVTFGLNELYEIDQEVFYQYKKSIVELKKIASKIVIVLAPINDELIKNSPIYNTVKEKMKNELIEDFNLKIIDLSDLGTNNRTAFLDPLHFKSEYVSKYLKEIVKRENE